jgi:hypothetical protein
VLPRCGTRESYLIEIQSGSFRPSGLRSKGAEVGTRGPGSRCSEN